MVETLHKEGIQILILIPFGCIQHNHYSEHQLWCEVQIIHELHQVWKRTRIVTKDGHRPWGHNLVPSECDGAVLREKKARRFLKEERRQDEEGRR